MSSEVTLSDIHAHISTNLHCPHELELYDGLIFISLSLNDIPYYFEIYSDSHMSIYSDSQNYASFVTDTMGSLPEISSVSIPMFIINQFIDSLSVDSAGFDDSDDECKDDFIYKNMKDFWKHVKSIANTDRSITVTSFGNKYKNFDTVKKSFDCSFNALHVRSSKKGLNLSKLRGTGDEVQRNVEQGKGFCDFIIELVTKVEKNDYSNIGIFCKAGHHRSVACVELLVKYVYKKGIVHHLNL